MPFIWEIYYGLVVENFYLPNVNGIIPYSLEIRSRKIETDHKFNRTIQLCSRESNVNKLLSIFGQQSVD